MLALVLAASGLALVVPGFAALIVMHRTNAEG